MVVFNDAEYTMVPVGALTVDESYQRDVIAKRVRQWREEGFDVALFGALAVARYPDETLAVWDGAHRLALARALGIDAVPCMVVARTRAEAALLFSRRQTTQKNLSEWERWKAEIKGGDEGTLALRRVVRGAGFEVKATAKRGTEIRAVAQVRKIAGRGGLDHLARVLGVCAVWHGYERQVLGHVLYAVGIYLERHPETDDAILRERLAIMTPHELDEQGKMLGRSSGGGSSSRSTPIADVIQRRMEQAARLGGDYRIEPLGVAA